MNHNGIKIIYWLYVRGKVNKQVTNRDRKEMNGDDIQTTFM
jgi:hypothetical protein